MEIKKGQYYIVRADRAGVFAGEIAEFDAATATVTMTNVRRIWYWDGAASLSQLATEGTQRPAQCKFTVTVAEMVILGVIEIIPCTAEAERNIKEVPVWRI